MKKFIAILFFLILRSFVAVSISEVRNDSVIRFQAGVKLSNEGRYEEAARVFQSIISEDSSYAAAHLALGIAYINLKRPEDALPHVRRATIIDSRNRKAYFILARLYERSEQRVNAMHAWEHYLTLNPEPKYGRVAKRHLQRLREDVR